MCYRLSNNSFSNHQRGSKNLERKDKKNGTNFLLLFSIKKLIILVDSIQVRIRSTHRNNQRQTLEEKDEKKKLVNREKR